MTATPSIAGLLQFIASQPSARPVDHSSYATCAVGAYAREALGHEVPVAVVGEATWEQIEEVQADPVINALWQEVGTERRYESSARNLPLTLTPSVMDILNTARGLPTTYGELASYLHQQRFGVIEPLIE